MFQRGSGLGCGGGLGRGRTGEVAERRSERKPWVCHEVSAADSGVGVVPMGLAGRRYIKKAVRAYLWCQRRGG